jgi:hypothetical protein
MRKIMTLLTFCMLSLISCYSQTNENLTIIKSGNFVITDTSIIPSDSKQFYFPLKVFNDNKRHVGRDTFVNSWYSKHLFAMKEPIIYLDKSQNEIYRFTWVRTFDNPIIVRIEKHGNTYILFWKLCNGEGGFEPGELTLNEQKTIDKTTWDEFKNRINQINFWDLETNLESIAIDGSQWILEGKTSNKYHVVDRHSPYSKSKFYECCDFLIRLTDLKINNEEKY